MLCEDKLGFLGIYEIYFFSTYWAVGAVGAIGAIGAIGAVNIEGWGAGYYFLAGIENMGLGWLTISFFS